jgi:hypothetical protein
VSSPSNVHIPAALVSRAWNVMLRGRCQLEWCSWSDCHMPCRSRLWLSRSSWILIPRSPRKWLGMALWFGCCLSSQRFMYWRLVTPEGTVFGGGRALKRQGLVEGL